MWSFELKILGSNSFYDEDLQGLMELIAAGKMKPVIDSFYPFDKALDAYHRLASGEAVGKIVISI